MRAVVHNQAQNSLTLNNNFPIPTPKADEYLVKINAAAICKGELLWPRPFDLNESHPGVEASGSVVTGPVNCEFESGAKIYLRTTFPRPGSAREYSVCLKSELALRPNNISAEEAACVPVSSLTAWQGLFVHGGIEPRFRDTRYSDNQERIRVLVNGASGSVGIWMTQLAHAAGCEVIGTCSAANEKMVRGFGADDVVDYTKTSVIAWAKQNPDRKCNLVLDTVGGKSLADAWFAAKEGGTVLSIVPRADMVWKWELDRPERVSETVKGRFYIMEPSGEQLARVTDLIERELVRPKLDSVWRMEEYEEAFERAESGKTAGKVVIKVSE